MRRENAAIYRANAVKCRELADQARGQPARRALLAAANSWLHMAILIESLAEADALIATSLSAFGMPSDDQAPGSAPQSQPHYLPPTTDAPRREPP